MKKIRICFVTSTYPRFRRDHIPGFVADLAEHLVAHHDVDVQVIAPHEGGLPRHEVLNGVQVDRFQYSFNPRRQCLAYGNGIPDNLSRSFRAKLQVPGFCLGMGWAILKALSHADIVHAHWIEPGLIAALANFPKRRPLVVTVHSVLPRLHRLHPFALRRPDRVLFNSQYTMNQAVGWESKINGLVMYQGYDEVFGQLHNTKIMKKKIGIPEKALTILSVGRMIPLKGMQWLLEASSRILHSRPLVHLVMVGDGPLRVSLEQQAKELKLSSQTHFTGALVRQEVAQLMAEADVFVNPGIVDGDGRAEGFGITTVEAMASGLACVGSQAGGIPEVIEDGVSGLLVEPLNTEAFAQSVEKLLDHPDLRQRMGNAGKARAKEKFSWPVISKKVADVYKQLLTGKA